MSPDAATAFKLILKAQQRKEDSVMSGVSHVNLDVLIDAALRRLPYNQFRLGQEASRYARRISMALARDLPEDLHEDIFHEAFAKLLDAGAAALVGTTGRKLFRKAIFAAVRTNRSNYTAPGQRTRTSREPLCGRVAAADIDRIPTAKELDAATVRDGVHDVIDVDRFPSVEAIYATQAVEDLIDVEKIMHRAPIDLRKAFRLIYFEDQQLAVAAAECGVSRFALARRMDRFSAPWRLAA